MTIIEAYAIALGCSTGRYRAVGQFFQRQDARVQALLRPGEPLAVKHRVDIARENIRDAIALLPRGTKPVGVISAAAEARAMPRGQRGGLVEKEQLGPAATAHHLTPPSPEFADASEPCLAHPAPRQQGLGCGVMNDAAI